MTAYPFGATIPAHGANMSGLSKNEYVENAEAGTHYNIASARDYAVLAQNNIGFVRKPISLNRCTPGQGAPLIEEYMQQIEQDMDNAHANGIKVLVEFHNYMRLPAKVATLDGVYKRDSQGVIRDVHGVAVTLTDAQGNPNAELFAPKYKVQPHAFSYTVHFDKRDGMIRLYEYRVIGQSNCPKLYNFNGLSDTTMRVYKRLRAHPAFYGIGIMNEPYTGRELVASSIRYENGLATGTPLNMREHYRQQMEVVLNYLFTVNKTHPVFVCGQEYASALRFTELSLPLLDPPDPHGLLVFEIHSYMDKNGAGGGKYTDRMENIDPQRFILNVQNAVETCAARGKRLFVGEWGFPAENRSAQIAMENGLRYLNARNIMSCQWCWGPGFGQSDELGVNYDVATSQPVPIKANASPLIAQCTNTYTSLEIPKT